MPRSRSLWVLGMVGFVIGVFPSHVFPNDYEVLSLPDVTWHDAQSDCESRGGYLATISSVEEDDLLTALLVQAIDPPTEGAYIGLTDEAQAGNWQWFTGEPVVYTNWDAGEPFGQGDWVMKWMYSSGGYLNTVGAWNDVRSPTAYTDYYICEYEAAWPTGTSVQASSLYGYKAANRSTALNQLAYVLIPMGVVFALRILRRKR